MSTSKIVFKKTGKLLYCETVITVIDMNGEKTNKLNYTFTMGRHCDIL